MKITVFFIVAVVKRVFVQREVNGWSDEEELSSSSSDEDTPTLLPTMVAGIMFYVTSMLWGKSNDAFQMENLCKYSTFQRRRTITVDTLSENDR